MTRKKIKHTYHKIKHMFKFKPVNFRRISLTLTESVDAWRIFPRLMIVAYGILIYMVCNWYFNIPMYKISRCDPASMKILVDSGVPIKDAQLYACNVSEVVGGPTMAQTTFVSTIIGMAPIIFGIYTSTGRKWDDGLPADIDRHPKFNAITPSPTPTPNPTPTQS